MPSCHCQNVSQTRHTFCWYTGVTPVGIYDMKKCSTYRMKVSHKQCIKMCVSLACPIFCSFSMAINQFSRCEKKGWKCIHNGKPTAIATLRSSWSIIWHEKKWLQLENDDEDYYFWLSKMWLSSRTTSNPCLCSSQLTKDKRTSKPTNSLKVVGPN